LPDAAQSESEEPEETGEGFAVVNPMNAAEPHQREAPKPIAEGQVPGFLPETS
jgi:hypothetical protein